MFVLLLWNVIVFSKFIIIIVYILTVTCQCTYLYSYLPLQYIIIYIVLYGVKASPDRYEINDIKLYSIHGGICYMYYCGTATSDFLFNKGDTAAEGGFSGKASAALEILFSS